MVSSPRTKPLHVLLVEDNPADVDLLVRGLRRSPHARFDVAHVATLAEAWVQLEDMTPDIVVLDLGLPDAAGTEGLEQLRERAPDVPVVALTGHADDQIALEVLRHGAQDFMSKADTDWVQLGRTLFHAIERHAVQQQLRATTEQLRAANARLEGQVELDPLTNLLNRRGLAGALPSVLAAAEREGKLPFALMADLDDFKQVNERLGYSTGDILMREVAVRVRESLRPGDRCGRLGGDELMVLFVAESEREAWGLAERVRIVLTEDFLMLHRQAVRITASFALVRLDPQHALLDRVMAAGEGALRISKKLGKNRISRHTGSELDEEDDDPERSRAIAALTRPEHYRRVEQPIIRLADEAVMGHEYLSRFDVAPYETPEAFFALASEAGVLTTVDHLCFAGCLQAARARPAEQRHHVNLLPATLLSSPPEHFAALLEGGPAVHVELSERRFAGHADELLEALVHLRRAGARICLDDVGFGRSSLESLVRLEPEVIKLGETRVRGCAAHPEQRRTLERLLAICRTTGAEVVAEGVETTADRDVVQDLGITLAQGYLWARPR
jgi:diguanylate cyclase (GGDEF)-like protein